MVDDKLLSPVLSVAVPHALPVSPRAPAGWLVLGLQVIYMYVYLYRLLAGLSLGLAWVVSKFAWQVRTGVKGCPERDMSSAQVHWTCRQIFPS